MVASPLSDTAVANTNPSSQNAATTHSPLNDAAAVGPVLKVCVSKTSRRSIRLTDHVDTVTRAAAAIGRARVSAHTQVYEPASIAAVDVAAVAVSCVVVAPTRIPVMSIAEIDNARFAEFSYPHDPSANGFLLYTSTVTTTTTDAINITTITTTNPTTADAAASASAPVAASRPSPTSYVADQLSAMNPAFFSTRTTPHFTANAAKRANDALPQQRVNESGNRKTCSTVGPSAVQSVQYTPLPSQNGETPLQCGWDWISAHLRTLPSFKPSNYIRKDMPSTKSRMKQALDELSTSTSGSNSSTITLQMASSNPSTSEPTT
ncbi:unnamed protein product [Phytophthora fragariaefolia]|uniref:Unnamed protein product n=1 Tax=Phytophthora fragariaefolia TaxID=1490495 RepID=A0A9W6UAI0_9STRA|nr:unnamed protein product [Phytophthora fragariaefolia]